MARLNHLANVVVSQLNTTVVMLGSFVVTPAILYGLGDGAYGGWLLINSFVQYMRFLDLGMSGGTTKYGAAAIEKEDEPELRRVLDTSAAIFMLMGTLGALATVVLTFALPHIYPTVAAGQGVSIFVLGAAITLDLLFRPFSATLRMRSLFYIHDGIETVAYCVFKLALVLYFASTGALSYRTLAFLTLGEAIVRISLVTSISVLRYPTSRRINPLRAERAMVRNLSAMGAGLTVITVAEIVRFQLDAAVIGYFMQDNPASISIFGVGTRLPSVAYSSIGVIGAVLLPKFSGLSATGDNEKLLILLRRASLSTGLVAAFILVNLAVLGPQFLELWLHKPWVGTSGRIMLLMLPAYYVGVLAGPHTMLLIGRAQLRGLAVLTVSEAATNFVLSVVLVRAYGIWGVALGTAIPLIFFRGVVFPFLLKKEIGVSVSEYFGMYKRAGAIGLLYLGLVSGLSFVRLPSYSRFVLLGLGSAAIFGVLVYALVPELRAGVQARLRRRKKTSDPPPSSEVKGAL